MQLYLYSKLFITILFNLDNEEATQDFVDFTNLAVDEFFQNLSCSAESWLLQHFDNIFIDGNITSWRIDQVIYFNSLL